MDIQPTGELSWGGQEVGGPGGEAEGGGQGQEHVLYGGPARHHPAPGPLRVAGQHPDHDCQPAGLWSGPRAVCVLFQQSNVPAHSELCWVLATHCTPTTPLFPLPAAILTDDSAARLRSLRSPEHKMSKSDPDPLSCIFLSDTPDQLARKVKSSVTDTTTKEL